MVVRAADGDIGSMAFAYTYLRNRGCLFRTLSDLQARYGLMWKVTIRGRTLHYLNDPNAVIHVLLRHERRYQKAGEAIEPSEFLGTGLLTSVRGLWRQRRTIIQPTFSDLDSMKAIVRDEVARAEVFLEERRGSEVDLADLAHRLVLRIAIRIFFGPDFKIPLEEIAETVSMAMDYLSGGIFNVGRMLPWRRRDVHRRVDAMREQIAHILDEGRPETMPPFVSQLRRSGLKPQEVADECLTMLFAGHETTASSLVWILIHLFAQSRSTLESIKEACAADATGGEDVPWVVRATVHETLRLYPPTWAMVRRADHDDQIAGRTIAKGDDVIIPVAMIQRREDVWAHPHSFSPLENFPSHEAAASLGRRGAFVPFSLGPRACVGQSLAQYELQTTIKRLCTRFDIVPIPGQILEPRYHILLRPPRQFFAKIV